MGVETPKRFVFVMRMEKIASGSLPAYLTNFKGEKMKENYTHITIVLDRSGSMESVKKDTIGGFNNFLESQKAVPGEATISLMQFDTEFDYIIREKTLPECQKLTDNSYIPRGGTALLDAIGRAVNETGAFLSGLPESERPSKVIFVILTDGHENSSREFKKVQINEMIKRQRELFSWEFVFLGANQDAIGEAADLGISVLNAMTYSGSSIGTKKAIHAMSVNTAAYRSGAQASMCFNPKQTLEQQNLINEESK